MVKYYPELMTNLYESQLRCQLDKRLLAISNGRDRLGRHILFFRAGNNNLIKINLNLNSNFRICKYIEIQVDGIRMNRLVTKSSVVFSTVYSDWHRNVKCSAMVSS